MSPEEIERIKADSRRAYKNDKTVGQHSLRKKVKGLPLCTRTVLFMKHYARECST